MREGWREIGRERGREKGRGMWEGEGGRERESESDRVKEGYGEVSHTHTASSEKGNTTPLSHFPYILSLLDIST